MKFLRMLVSAPLLCLCACQTVDQREDALLSQTNVIFPRRDRFPVFDGWVAEKKLRPSKAAQWKREVYALDARDAKKERLLSSLSPKERLNYELREREVVARESAAQSIALSEHNRSVEGQRQREKESLVSMADAVASIGRGGREREAQMEKERQDRLLENNTKALQDLNGTLTNPFPLNPVRRF